MKKELVTIIVAGAMIATMGPVAVASQRPEDDLTMMLPENQYELRESVEVNGRQGVCSEGNYYWVSGSTSLAKYDKDWKLIELTDDPFAGYELEVNHIADIDVYQNELYIGAEYFMDGVGKNIQIAVYDGDTLELKRTFSFEPDSGQLECSGIAVDPDTKTVWMCSWVGEESGRYLYKYDLETGEYLGKVHLQMPPQWLQGIAYHDGCLYMTADDGTADDDEPDHLYRTKIEDGATNCIVTLERTFDDVIRQGEIEGLTFDEESDQLLVLYNRGARIVLGMPKGFYDGYDREISEVYMYSLSKADTETEAEVKALTVQISPENFSDKGNVKLFLGREEIEGAGYSFGDMLTVRIGDQTIDLPYGSSYSDVDSGCPALICRDQDDRARLTVNMGSFVAEYLQGVRDEEKGEWSFPKETTWPLTVTISMKEKGGYYDEYLLHRLSYTNERNDYPNLTDEEFGNFREITTTGMGKGILYRCSSPIDSKIGRNLYVDQALRDAGVTVVMNLTDTAEKAESFEGFKDSYYSTTDYISLNCAMDFTTDSFRKKLREGLEFFAGHPGVYAVHCLEGKDRTGIVIALLECLMGADIDEVVDDYMTTFYNYYGVTRDDERYEIIADSNIRKSLKNMFGVSDLESADLSKCAEEYLAGIGMSSENIEALENNLSAFRLFHHLFMM